MQVEDVTAVEFRQELCREPRFVCSPVRVARKRAIQILVDESNVPRDGLLVGKDEADRAGESGLLRQHPFDSRLSATLVAVKAGDDGEVRGPGTESLNAHR